MTIENIRYKPKQLILIGFAFVILVTFFSYVKFHRYTQGLSIVVSSDAEGYNQYLTALFIKKDIFNQPYSYRLENGKLFNKYNYGIALLQLPFFLIAHIIAHLFDLPAEGKFTPYVFSVIIAGAFYTFIGLLLLFTMIRQKYRSTIAWISIGVIFLGTNLLFYAYRSPGASHVYAFFLVSCFVWLVHRFYKHPDWKSITFLSIVLGILALIRITHLMVLVYLLLYKVNSIKDLKDNVRFLNDNLKFLLLIPAGIILFYIPQSFYWHALTGEYFVNPYKYSLVEEGFFNWNNPKVGLVLFGPVGGWLVLSPVMILALAGLYRFFRDKDGSPWGIFIILVLTTYIYGSWWHPTLAGSYGHRGFIDIYPFLVLPLAYFIHKIYYTGRKSFLLLSSVLVIMVYINVRMSFMYRYWWWDVEWGWEGYFRTLLEVFYI